MNKRKYTKTKRLESQEQTRLRIVIAAMVLHEELGPANTSIKAIAEKAGVQRLTVYRHFPDEERLFMACSSHWLSLNPPPDAASWENIEQASARADTALINFYQYYRSTEAMWTKVYRDIELVPVLKDVLAGYEGYLDAVRDGLLAGWKLKAKSKRQLSSTLRHAMGFSTWRSLEDEGLSDKQKADLVLKWIQAFTG